MKTIKYFGMVLFMGIMSVNFLSCGSDDDDESDGGSSAKSGKHLVKLTEQGGKNTYTYEYTYDSQDRIIRSEEKKNGEYYSHYTFSYSDNLIVRKHYYASGSSGSPKKYIVENGVIVSEQDEYGYTRYTYTYSNGYLASRTSDGSTYNYTWKGGNLVSREHEGIIKTFEYTNYTAPLGFILVDVDYELAQFYGKTPKNLLSKYNFDDGYLTYDWTISNGLPTKLVETEMDEGDMSTHIYTFEWE